MNPEDYFKSLPQVKYEGPDSTSDLAYRHYDKTRMVMGKSMEEHLRLAVCFWHSFCWDGFDVFGAGTFDRPWHAMSDQKAAARAKRVAAFDFFKAVDLPYYCFHDVDVMEPATTPKEHVANLNTAVDHLEDLMAKTGRKLLWGTANNFSHPRYMAGAATNPNPDIAAFAGLQVREAMNATHRLGGENYVLWGGREGYDTILNTDLGHELDQFGRFLEAVVAHKHKIGFTGDILIEPKPHEPTKHQYDSTVQTVHAFLQRYGLEKEVRVNIEANHATLAGLSFEHEVDMAFALGIFGSIDLNRGDPQNGWDTDQFPNDLREITLVMKSILENGGFGNGGLNFDAKIRRQSISMDDLAHAHVGAVDLIARALLNAEAMIEDGRMAEFKAERYAGWKSGIGAKLLKGEASLDEVADSALSSNVSPEPVSGRQEWLENLVTEFTK
ncbi:MAG: xylose isomerase [Pacificimonas sp.]